MTKAVRLAEGSGKDVVKRTSGETIVRQRAITCNPCLVTHPGICMLLLLL